MAEDRNLPGWPKKKLVRDVRKHLRSFGISPSNANLWYETWAWANQIKSSYVYERWPLPSEIGAQYVFLLLMEMHTYHALRLPFRAATHQPESVKRKLASRPDASPLQLPAPSEA